MKKPDAINETLLEKQNFFTVMGLSEEEILEKIKDESDYCINPADCSTAIIPTTSEFIQQKKSLVDKNGNKYFYNICNNKIIDLFRVDRNGIFHGVEDDLVELQGVFKNLLSNENSNVFPDCIYLHDNHLILYNGDINDDFSFDFGNHLNHELKILTNGEIKNCVVTFSISCLSNLLVYSRWSNHTVKIGEMLNNGILKIVDFTNDESIPFTEKEIKSVKNSGKTIYKTFRLMKPPKLGFSPRQVNNIYVWHRPATFLIRHTTDKEDYSILMGMDEGSYFASVLVDHPKNVQGAFTSLMPKRIRRRNVVDRQGEWFVVESKSPSKKDIAISCKELTLPRESDESSQHMITTNYTRNSNCVVTKDNKFFVTNFLLEHGAGEHDDIKIYDNSWYELVRNTAVRSASSESMVD